MDAPHLGREPEGLREPRGGKNDLKSREAFPGACAREKGIHIRSIEIHTATEWVWPGPPQP